jgi:hypothetical protein
MTVSAGPRYELVEGWEKAPAGHSRRDVAGVGIDAQDHIYVVTRPAQVLVYHREGSFLRAWQPGLFSDDVHGVTVGPDGSLYIADNGDHTVRKFSAEGELVMTLGNPGVPADTGFDPEVGPASIVRAGPPFNNPNNVALGPDGDLFVADGYGNARVHRFSAEGQLLKSWGEPGTGPGQFSWPHAVWVLNDERLLVGDRENNRIQVFGLDGRYLEQWHNVQRPTDIFVDREGWIHVTEFGWRQGQRSPLDGIVEQHLPGRVSILDRTGQVVSRFGAGDGENPGPFWAPHSLCVDSRGDLYVGEVVYSYAGLGKAGRVPAGCRSLHKFARK